MIPVADLYPLRDLYNAGQYLKAHAAGAPWGPLPAWQGPAARLFAGRLLIQLGSPRRGHQLHALAYRESPAYPEAVYYQARYRLESFSPLSALTFIHRHTDWADAPPELRADWASLTALCYARLADFDHAERLLKEAEELAGVRPWFAVERASVYELLDRPEPALESARLALELQPNFRPGVQAVSHLLLKRGRADEAEAILRRASDELESGVVTAQLATVLYDRGDYAGALATLDRYERLSPLMEREVRSWLAARRADTHYRLGNRDESVVHARQVGEPFYAAFADALAGPPAGVPIRLAVDLAPVADDSPQTYDLLTRYWNQPRLTPVEPTGPPSLDGSPDVVERERFDAAGWHTQELTLTGDRLADLLGRGIPVILTLVEAGFGQPRLAIGHDPIRQSVLLADPTERRPAEAPLATLLERFAASGPRLLVALPPGEESRLEGFAAADRAEYDTLYQFHKALRARQVEVARSHLKTLQEQSPGSRLTLMGELIFARATVHPVLQLEAARKLRELHPKDNSLVLAEVSALRELGRHRERLSVLRQTGSARDSEPLIAQSLAQMLLPHQRTRGWADITLRRSLCQRPTAAPGYYLLASLRWEQLAFDEALELYRLASCLDADEEQFADAYRKAAQALGRSPEAVRFFARRANRTPRPHPPSVAALVQTLAAQGDPDLARSALNQAVERAEATRPPGPGADPVLRDLLLARIDWVAARREFAQAEADLSALKLVAAHAVWLRAAHKVARAKPAYTEAALHALELYRLEPHDLEAIRLHMVGLTETEGRQAARVMLEQSLARHPHDYPLGRLLAEFVYPEGDEHAVLTTRRLLDLCPRDAWTWRQLALLHADRKEHDAALEALAESARTEPDHPSYYSVLAHAHRRADRPEDALTALRDSVALYPDHELAVYELAQLAPGTEAKEEALEYIADALREGPTTGDGFLAWFAQSTELVADPESLEELLRVAQAFHDERPDLWQTASALGQVLINSQRAEEAYTLFEESAERFPLVARVWFDLALAARITDRPEDRLLALERAIVVAPSWLAPSRELAEALDEGDRPQEALEVLERFAVEVPTDALAHWLVAEKLWSLDRGREALDRAKLAVRLDLGTDPRAETAWGAVLGWADRIDAADEPLELARELADDRPGDPRAWLRLARTITDMAEARELLEALDHAIRLDPKNVEAYDLKAERLAALGQIDEALRAARPEILLNDLPLVLQGRTAWIEARRQNYPAAISGMQALVAVDPDYTWGWQQLAEWYNDTGRSEQFLEAAGQFLRLRPDHPVPLTLRGEARLQVGDRDDGKEDLREALRIHPSYSPAAVILFDACLADQEYREARAALAVLQEHLTGPEVLVKQVQFGAKAGEPRQAERAFKELARWPGEQPAMFLQIALTEMLSHDLGQEAGEILGDAWRSEPDADADGPGFNPWAPLLWLDTVAGMEASDADRLAATERVTAAYPRFAPGADRHAEMLADLDRFDDARAVCLAVGDPPPVALQGRLAWVEARAGDRPQAIAMMQRVVEAEPNYSWGWRQLTIWFSQLDRHRECAGAADQLVRLNPGDPIAHVIRGEARLAHGDVRGARDDFERAYDADPDLSGAGLQLAHAQLLTDDFPGAAKTLARLAAQSPGPQVTARQARLASRVGDWDSARARLGELLADPNAYPSLYREVFDDFAQAGWASEADAELDRAVAAGGVTPTAAGVWVERRLAAGRPDEVADRLAELAKLAPDPAREAVLQYAERTASYQPRAAHAAVQRFSELLRGEVASWSRAGAVLVRLGEYQHAAVWLADYRDRDGVDAGSLVPLLDAHLALGDDAAAEAVARLMTERADEADDEPPAEAIAWLAVFAAHQGDIDAADDWLDAVETVGQPDPVRLVLTFAEVLVTIRRSADRPRTFRELQADLKSAATAWATPHAPPGAARWYRLVVRQLAAETGTWRAKLWALGQHLRPWLRGA